MPKMFMGISSVVTHLLLRGGGLWPWASLGAYVPQILPRWRPEQSWNYTVKPQTKC